MKKYYALTLLAVCLTLVLSGCGCKHEWIDATCETPRTCTQCAVTEGEALNHNWTEATCISAKTCSACGKEEGAALGHEIEWALCADNDESMEGTCSICSEKMTEPVDWAAVAPSLLMGEWGIESLLYMNAEKDGTALVVFDGEETHYTWKLDKVVTDPINIIYYTFTDENGTETCGYFMSKVFTMFMLKNGEGTLHLIR